MIEIAVVDDHPLIAEGVRGWCAVADPPITVTATFGEPGAFLAAVPPVVVDAVVFDMQFGGAAPDRDSLQRLCALGYRVVVLSQNTDPDLVVDCLDIGVVTYLSKSEGREHLIDALHAAVADRPYHSQTMIKAMLLGRAPHRPRLSGRELEVLRLWFQTDSKAMVARKLYLTPATVETYLARIRTKYAAVGRPAPSKAALVARAIQDGLVTADEL